MTLSTSASQKTLRYVIRKIILSIDKIYKYRFHYYRRLYYIFLSNVILYHHRRDSGFVGIQDLGTNVDLKVHTDNSDGIISIPSRRQSRIFSMDLSFLGTEEDHDRIVNKYKQVSYCRSSQNFCTSKLNFLMILILTYFCFMYNHCVRLLLWPYLTI